MYIKSNGREKVRMVFIPLATLVAGFQALGLLLVASKASKKLELGVQPGLEPGNSKMACRHSK